jgi:ferredoxin
MQVNRNKCLYCGGCVGVCPQQAIELKETVLSIDPKKCSECGLCFQFCPVGALTREGK